MLSEGGGVLLLLLDEVVLIFGFLFTQLLLLSLTSIIPTTVHLLKCITLYNIIPLLFLPTKIIHLKSMLLKIFKSDDYHRDIIRRMLFQRQPHQIPTCLATHLVKMVLLILVVYFISVLGFPDLFYGLFIGYRVENSVTYCGNV